MRNSGLIVLCSLLCSIDAQAQDAPEVPLPSPPNSAHEPTYHALPSEELLWYRNAGEYIASRSTRTTLPTDVNSKIITDAKRFDVSVGKRLPLFRWAEEGRYSGWSAGIDGGMLASLVRYTNNAKFTFATNTFDGFFGAYIGHGTADGWLGLLRFAHLSAHLVDNSPRFANPIAYSQFWTEIIAGKTFPAPSEISDWDLHLQANLGLNNTATPSVDQPRAGFGADFGYAFDGPNSLGLLASADATRAGVMGQRVSYAFFLGLGYLKRPTTTHRPFRFGLAYFRGSDYRNQVYFDRQNWLTFELAAEF
jgi:hypothetical protein